MPLSNYPSVATIVTPRRLSQFEERLAQIEKARNTRAIPNATFTEARTTMNRIMEDVWNKKIMEPLIYARDAGTAHEERAFILDLTSYPQVHTMASVKKKMARAPAGPAIDEVNRYFEEFAPLAELVNEAKEFAVKRQPKPPAENPIEKYQAPAASRTAMKAVYDELMAITAETRGQITERITRSVTSHLDALMKMAAEKPCRVADYVRHISPRRRDTTLMSDLGALTERSFVKDADGRPRETAARRQDWEQILRDRAARRAEEICTVPSL